MYFIVYSDSAAKFLKKSEKDIQRRIISSIERCSIRPHHFVKKLVGSQHFRLRVGNYRVIMDIRDNKLIIFVVYIEHRSRVYD